MAERRGRRKRGLPAGGLAVLYVIAASAPLILAWTTGLPPAELITEAASATGLIACAMLLAQFATSGRFETLSRRIGIDRSMGFHKWAGHVLLLLVLLHPILFALPSSVGRIDVFWARLVTMLGSSHYLTGVIALGLVIVLVVWAIFRNRLPVRYEWWRAIHDLLALAAAWLAVLHAVRVGTYSSTNALGLIWPALAVLATVILLGVYGVRTFVLQSRGWRVVSNRQVANRLWEVVVARDVIPHDLRFQAGQFAWLTFAPRRFPLFDHPFSIASSPENDSSVKFLIKEAGDFTDRIGRIALDTPAGIDGPHGHFTVEGIEAGAVLLVAGGAGIAPILGILSDLDARRDRRPIRLVYADQTPGDLIRIEEIRMMTRNLDFDAELVVERADADWPHRIGRVDRDILSEALSDLPIEKTLAMVCGPGPMVAAASDHLEALGVPPRNIRYEQFDYASRARSAKDRRVTFGFRMMGAMILLLGSLFALR